MVNADATSNCSSAAVARFDWSLGIADVVYDSTATCASGGGDPSGGPASLYIKDGGFYLKDGRLYLKN